LGPLIGGIATQLFSWRATFYFLVIFASLALLTFIFFKDTFRRERSLSYQNALRHVRKEQEAKLRAKEKNHSHTPNSLKFNEKTGSMSTHDLEVGATPELQEIRLGLREVNPIRPVIAIIKRPNNLAILAPSCTPSF